MSLTALPGLYLGDIVAALKGDGVSEWPMLVTGPAELHVEHNVLARATMMSEAGKARPGYGIYICDRLVACGRHEDCRASLDLAMACAEQRVAATHQVSVATNGERPER